MSRSILLPAAGGSASGAAGGDLAGTYPNPTIAESQGAGYDLLRALALVQCGWIVSSNSNTSPQFLGLYGGASQTAPQQIDIDAGGTTFNYQTSTSIDTDAGFWYVHTGQLGRLHRRANNSVFILKFRQGQSTGRRDFIGLSDSIIPNILASDNPTGISLIGLQVIPSSANLQFVSKDGAFAGGLIRVNSGIVISTTLARYVRITLNDAAGSGTVEILDENAAVLATNVFSERGVGELPPSGTFLTPTFGVRNTVGGAGSARGLVVYTGMGFNR